MAYPTDSLSLFLQKLDVEMLSVKRLAERAKTQLESGPVDASSLISLVRNLRLSRATLVSLSAKPGMADYAKDIKNDQTLDVVAEFVSVRNAIDACVDWVVANFPKDANGFLLRETWGQDGPVDRTFSSASTVQLANLLGVLSEAIA